MNPNEKALNEAVLTLRRAYRQALNARRRYRTAMRNHDKSLALVQTVFRAAKVLGRLEVPKPKSVK